MPLCNSYKTDLLNVYFRYNRAMNESVKEKVINIQIVSLRDYLSFLKKMWKTLVGPLNIEDDLDSICDILFYPFKSRPKKFLNIAPTARLKAKREEVYTQSLFFIIGMSLLSVNLAIVFNAQEYFFLYLLSGFVLGLFLILLALIIVSYRRTNLGNQYQ